MIISKNFTLEEFLISQTAIRHRIDMTPTLAVQNSIIRLVDTVIQPLRTELGHPISINSGYRPEDLNSLIGGSKTSAHRFGCAADIRSNSMEPLELARLIELMDLPYDQVIHEFGAWVHVGIRWDSQDIRKQLLTAYSDDRGKTVYMPGLLPMSDFL